MTEQFAIDVARQALYLTLQLAGPLLAGSLGLGMGISIFQAVTQINEQTMSFVPKILAVAGTMAVLGPWMGQEMVSFTVQMFKALPGLAH